MSGGQRMFVAVIPPEDVIADLEAFVEPRRDADPRLRWVDPEHWHVTLAFLPAVHHRSLDDLEERLDLVAAQRDPMELWLHDAGAFPDAAQAKALWLGVREAVDDRSDTEAARSTGLAALARATRAAANNAGTAVDGQRFHPHLTLARTRPAFDVTRWLQILGTYAGPSWFADEVVLIASHLGQGRGGRPRYERYASFPLGR